MQNFLDLIESIGTPVIVGLLLAYFQHLNNKRYEKMDKRADLRKREGEVNAEMTEATMKLAYASAMALKRGTPNGEVEEGIAAYNKALKKRKKFIEETSREYLR